MKSKKKKTPKDRAIEIVGNLTQTINKIISDDIKKSKLTNMRDKLIKKYKLKKLKLCQQ